MKRVNIQVICLGSNGGPSEADLSSFLVREAPDNTRLGSDSQYISNPIVSVDSGCLFASIDNILRKTALEHTSKPISTLNKSSTPSVLPSRTRFPFADIVSRSSKLATLATDEATCILKTPADRSKMRRQRVWEIKRNSMKLAKDLMLRHIKSFLITHPHLDHMAAFVTNSPIFAEQAGAKRPSICGTLQDEDKKTTPPSQDTVKVNTPPILAGSARTLEAMRLHMFNDVIWPNLIAQPALLIQTKALVDNQASLNELDGPRFENTQGGRSRELSVTYSTLAPGVSVAAFDISHGLPPKTTEADLGGHSTAYFLRFGDHSQNPSQTPAYSRESPHKEVLILGDVEPDTISNNPRNFSVWKYTSQLITARRLSAIFIECSFADSRSDKLLFGHLKPKHLVEEIVRLSKFVQAEKIRVMTGKGARIIPSAQDERDVVIRKRLPSPLSSPSPEIKRARVDGTSSGSVSRNTGENDDESSYPAGDLNADFDLLQGLTVYIMHIKRDGSEDVAEDLFGLGRKGQEQQEEEDTADEEDLDDYDPVADLLIQQCQDHAKESNLLCKFAAVKPGWGYHV